MGTGYNYGSTTHLCILLHLPSCKFVEIKGINTRLENIFKTNMKSCRVCKSSGPFSPSRIKRCDWICNRCTAKACNKRRKKDPLRRLAYNYYQRVHKKGVPTRVLSREEVAKILEQCNVTDPSNICLYKDDESGKIIAISSTKARSIAHRKKISV